MATRRRRQSWWSRLLWWRRQDPPALDYSEEWINVEVESGLAAIENWLRSQPRQ